MNPRPNLLIVLTDQLRRHALSCYGDNNIETPHIDKMAEEGVRFSQSCCTYPICVPSRFTFMTGEYAHSRMVPGISWRMSPAERTLADEYNEAGYDTIYIGKWHLYGHHHQFETMDWNQIQEHSRMTAIPKTHQGRWKKWLGFEYNNAPFDSVYFEDDDPTPQKIDGFQTDGLFDLAFEQLSQRKDQERPFCMVLSVEPPHFPLGAPEALVEKWRDKVLELAPNVCREGSIAPMEYKHNCELEQVQNDLRLYYAMVENLDQNMGRLEQMLSSLGLLENTNVLLTSDHGEMAGSQNFNLGAKFWPFEESVGIPLIVRGPSVPKGEVISHPTNMEDLFPTFLALSGLPSRPDLQGQNLLEWMENVDQTPTRHGVLLEYVCDHFGVFHGRQWRAFRSKDHVYTVIGNDYEGGKPWQFYDLREDPHQLNNLIESEQHRDAIQQHHEWLSQALVETQDHYHLAALD